MIGTMTTAVPMCEMISSSSACAENAHALAGAAVSARRDCVVPVTSGRDTEGCVDARQTLELVSGEVGANQLAKPSLAGLALSHRVNLLRRGQQGPLGCRRQRTTRPS